MTDAQDYNPSMHPLAITLGDPAGIGAEIVFRSLPAIDPALPLWLFGDWNLARQSPGAESIAEMTVTRDPAAHRDAPRLFIDAGSGDGNLKFGTIDATYGRVALDSIDAALTAIAHGRCSALVTAPIHKLAVAAAGSPFPGHTELLAARAGLTRYGHDYAMYFDSPTIRTVLLSVHVSLREAIDLVTSESVLSLARLAHRELPRVRPELGNAPRIGVAGLNPPAGEGGKFGREEEAIRHAVELGRLEGLDVSGPHAADTLFLAAARGSYDVVLAMYHDQGLIPVKTMEFERSVNVTLGLPYLRASVDHGTAFDIAGRGIADATPMKYAIEWTAAHHQGAR
jgi:4-hydroxythreonine-4-phosphate dehydrogenase